MIDSFFFSFEGLDGSGKDSALNTIFNLFYEETGVSPLFFSKYQNVLRTREPTLISSPGQKISQGLASKKILNWPIQETAKLFIADRQHHCQFIRRALSEKVIVLCSRYDLSTFAYQMAQGVTFTWMYDQHFYHQPMGCLIPDLTFYFRLSPETAWQRINKRQQPVGKNGSKESNKEAFEKRTFLEKTFHCYEKVVKELPKKDNRQIAVIDAERSIEKVKEDVISTVESYLSKR